MCVCVYYINNVYIYACVCVHTHKMCRYIMYMCVCVYTYVGFPWGSDGKESACNARDLGSIPGLGRSPGEGKGYPLQYSGRKNSIDCIVHRVTESDTTKGLSLSNTYACESDASQVVLVVKNPSANAGEARGAGLMPGWGRPPWGGHGNLLQYACLENFMGRGAQQATGRWYWGFFLFIFSFQIGET